MTKRACPFEVGVLRQFKTHVHTFDWDKAAMKEIENKTVEKLFLAQKNNTGSCHNTNPSVSCTVKEKNMRQKQLSSYFNNRHGGLLDKEVKNSLDIGDGMNVCTYCDKSCENTYECTVCSDQFCQSCSFADYNAATEGVRICITCS